MARDAELAVLVRAAQWELDEAAFELGGGRYPEERRKILADQLVELANALRLAPRRDSGRYRWIGISRQGR